MLSTNGIDVQIGPDSENESLWSDGADLQVFEPPNNFGVLDTAAMAKIQNDLEDGMDDTDAEVDIVSFRGAKKPFSMPYSFPGNRAGTNPEKHGDVNVENHFDIQGSGGISSGNSVDIVSHADTEHSVADRKHLIGFESALSTLVDDESCELGFEGDLPVSNTMGALFSNLGSAVDKSGISQVSLTNKKNVKGAISGKRSIDYNGKGEKTHNKRFKTSSDLLSGANLRNIVSQPGQDTSTKSNLSFLDPSPPRSKRNEKVKDFTDNEMWLFDKEEEQKEDILAFPLQEPSRRNQSFQSQEIQHWNRGHAFEKREDLWTHTHAGQGNIIDISSRLGLVEEDFIKDIRRGLISSLQSDIGATSPSYAFVKALLATTIEAESIDTARLDKLSVLLQERLPHLAPEELAVTVLGMADVGYKNDRILKEIWMHIESSQMIRECNPSALSGISLGLGLLGWMNVKAGKALEDRILEIMDSSEGFSNFDQNAFASLLQGCSMTLDEKMGKSLIIGIIDHVCADPKTLKKCGWSNIAAMLSLSCGCQSVPEKLLLGLNERLRKGTKKLKASEFVLMLKGLCYTSREKKKFRVLRAVKQSIDTLVRCTRNEEILNGLKPSFAPDLIFFMSLVSRPEERLMEKIGALILKGMESFPAWVLVRKVLEGYSRLLYFDDEVLKALNSNLVKHDFSTLPMSTLSKVITSGWTLGASDNSILDKVLHELRPESVCWYKCTAITAARTAWGLAGWRKLTPEVLRSCAERCKDFNRLPVGRDPLNSPQGTCMRGLFAGYHFIKVKHGSTVAQSCFPDGLLDHVLHHMRLFRGETTIATIPIQGEISKELSDMGLHNTLKPLLGGGLYNADIALHARKVVILVDNSASHSINPPHKLLGHAVLRQQQLEDLRIKVVRIHTGDWKQLRPSERKDLISRVFKNHNINITSVTRTAKKQNHAQNELEAEAGEPPIEMVERWAGDRTLITNGLLKKKVEDIADRRGIFQSSEDLITLTNKTRVRRRQLKKPNRSKHAVVEALVAFEAKSLYQSQLPIPVESVIGSSM